MDLNDVESISRSRLELELGRGRPVHHSGGSHLHVARPAATDQDDLVYSRVERMRRIGDDQRAVHAAIRLHQLVHVRVIYECPRARRRELSDE